MACIRPILRRVGQSQSFVFHFWQELFDRCKNTVFWS
jgi:hypothetical protein